MMPEANTHNIDNQFLFYNRLVLSFKLLIFPLVATNMILKGRIRQIRVQIFSSVSSFVNENNHTKYIRF